MTDSLRLLGKCAFHMRNRIAEHRLELGLTKTEVARRIGTSKQHYGRLESGETGLDAPWLKKLAKALRCRPVDLIPELGDGALSAALVGDVGAGERVLTFAQSAIEQVESPPGSGEVHALRVRGDAMWPAYRGGDLLYFVPADGFDAKSCLLHECIVEVLDGPTYVKRVLPGSGESTYILTSYRAAELFDVRIRWASPVLWVKRAG
ncbi:MAG: helix-turn-helix domain-containing protein [Myxococcota bacterium]